VGYSLDPQRLWRPLLVRVPEARERVLHPSLPRGVRMSRATPAASAASSPSRENTHEQKMAVTWACQTITHFGGTLYPAGRNAWDVETKAGWIGCNSIADLCAAARDLQADRVVPS
jgi:hypothetical protein